MGEVDYYSTQTSDCTIAIILRPSYTSITITSTINYTITTTIITVTITITITTTIMADYVGKRPHTTKI